MDGGGENVRVRRPQGKVTLLDLFEGRRQLVLYRAFFEPGVFGWPEHACRGCSLGADQVSNLIHLNVRDTTLAYASRAPQADIARLKTRMGWEQIPWYTMTDSFDVDFGVDQWHGHNIFFRDGERVFRTYFVNERGDEAMGTIWSYLDFTPLGRQETWEDSPEGYPQTPPYKWWNWHDNYEPDASPDPQWVKVSDAKEARSERATRRESELKKGDHFVARAAGQFRLIGVDFLDVLSLLDTVTISVRKGVERGNESAHGCYGMAWSDFGGVRTLCGAVLLGFGSTDKSSRTCHGRTPDFDFLVGHWRVHHRKLKDRLANSHEWVEFEGTLFSQPLMGGYANVDDDLFEVPGGTYRGVAPRSFDAKSGQWSIWWMDSRTPLATLDPPVRGSFYNGVGTFYGDDTLKANQSASDSYGLKLHLLHVTGSRHSRPMVAKREKPIGYRNSNECNSCLSGIPTSPADVVALAAEVLFGRARPLVCLGSAMPRGLVSGWLCKSL